MPHLPHQLIAAALLLTGFAYATAPTPNPIDPDAEPETRNLLLYLAQCAQESVLFGHQDTTAYGIGWRHEDARSDVKSVTGAFPAVYGWDFLNWIAENDSDVRERHRKLVTDAYQRGGVNTFSWHMDNPATGKNFYDTTPAVQTILPGGIHHEAFTRILDNMAAFAHSLNGRDGNHIPIIFRPFHEHTGSWFWWGNDHCSGEDYIALWRFTVTYLRDQKGVHNFLYAYSPNIAYGAAHDDQYLARYPGDDYVDILGLDAYVPHLKSALPALRKVVDLAAARGKIPALTETGFPEGLSKTERTDWYTRCLLAPLRDDPVARRIAYLLVWRNAHEDHFWVPYPGHPAADDFRAFHAAPLIRFGDNLPSRCAPPPHQAR